MNPTCWKTKNQGNLRGRGHPGKPLPNHRFDCGKDCLVENLAVPSTCVADRLFTRSGGLVRPAPGVEH